MSYEGDVTYEIWRRGGDPDRIHPDTVSAYENDGYSAEETASAYMRRAERHRQEQIIAELEEYPEEECEPGDAA